MKKIVFGLIVLAFAFVSCEQEDDKQIDQNAELKKEITFDQLTKSTIGFENEGKVQLGVSNNKVMETFKKFVKTNDLDIDPLSFEIISIDQKNYLRFYSEKNQVSTIELFINSNKLIETGSTVCTSIACASGGGCIPYGSYCTECGPHGPDGPKADCKRTTTG